MEKSFVIIEWLDSAEEHGWTDPRMVCNQPPASIQSIGILLQEPTKDNPYYIICRDLGESLDTCCGVMRIPKVAVLRMDHFDWPKGFEKGFYDDHPRN